MGARSVVAEGGEDVNALWMVLALLAERGGRGCCGCSLGCWGRERWTLGGFSACVLREEGVDAFVEIVCVNERAGTPVGRVR